MSYSNSGPPSYAGPSFSALGDSFIDGNMERLDERGPPSFLGNQPVSFSEVRRPISSGNMERLDERDPNHSSVGNQPLSIGIVSRGIPSVYDYNDGQAPGYSELVRDDWSSVIDEDRWVWVDSAEQDYIVDSCCNLEDSGIAHSWHDHDLILTHVLHDNTEDFDRNCSGCLEKLTSSADPHYYYCKECDYSLHKLCATLHKTKQHPLHTEHQLEFKVEPPHQFGQGKCKCCEEMWSNFTYSCLECDIDIDINCATVGEHKMKHWIHPPHELTLVSGEIDMNCAFCGKKHQGSFFHCTTCEKPNSWIHSQCAQYPKRLPFQCLPDPKHEHPLKIALESEVLCDRCKKVITKGPRYKCNECRYNVHSACTIPESRTTKGATHKHKFEPSDESQISCDICEKDIPKGSPRYKCTDKCLYSVHIECAILPPMTPTEVLYIDYEKSIEGVPNLPFPDNSYSLVKHHLLKLKSASLNPFIHDHPLVLFNQPDEGDIGLSSSGGLNKLMKKLKLICKMCGQLITEYPFYRCEEECCINFLLHKWCANLPIELKEAPCHTKHPLYLQPKYSQLFGSLGLFKCDVCGLWCDGFSYSCDECDFNVDMNCAFLLKNIKHKNHPLHPLRLTRFRAPKKSQKCVACSVRLDDGVFVYQCFKCNFFLHTECSLLPSKIRHRYEKDNYKLTYTKPRKDLRYFCDICEQLIDTKQWFYDCDTCVQSVHAGFAACIKPYNKVLRLIRIGDHPHGFSLISIKQEGELCSFCKEPISTLPFFRCSTCGFLVDSWCVPKMIRESIEKELNSIGTV